MIGSPLRRRGIAGILLGAVASLLSVGVSPHLASAHDSDNHPADEFYTNPPSWNGKKIYLSPAHHWSGPNQGCGSYVEDDNMLLVARQAGILDNGGSLWDRGYKVRVGRGDPDDNTERSNSWGSNRHIPLHSNAHSMSTGCGFSTGGTQVFYSPGSSNGQNLANKLENKVGPSSPGSGSLEYVASNTGLYELNQTTMPAAYLEAEFHDWVTGKNWLKDYSSWGWRIGWAVDVHLGYP